jgi:hypothetical protein
MTENKFKNHVFPGFDIVTRDSEDWKFQSVQTEIDGMLICYTRFMVPSSGDRVNEVLETYSGSNYIPGSKDKSYSRVYGMDRVPTKHQTTVNLMKTCLTQELSKRDIKILSV